jgi:DNA repair exonuclease SbcCD ATPase subunit
MKTTKITIRNLFGISERTLDGHSVELSGPKGTGKTSVLDAIRYALTNRSDRDYIIRQGADEGEILIETDTGLNINRKARTNAADSVKVRDGSLTHTRPAEFLNKIFTPLQLNPIEFTQMSRQEKNRVILNLVEFPWDTNWIAEQFGEIPRGVDYSKHILEVLADIQSEDGAYYKSRQNINRDIRNNLALIEEIAKDIPDGYQAEKWEKYPLGEKYGELDRIKEHNATIERAKAFKAAYEDKKRGIQATRDMDIAAEEKRIQSRRENINLEVERLRSEIRALETERDGLDVEIEKEKRLINSQDETALAKLDKDTDIADKYINEEPTDTTALQAEVETAEAMKRHLNEYRRMTAKQAETDELTAQSEELTRKIELARELPSEILKTATIPIAGLTVENGVPLINGLPVSNLSGGETLDLCVEIAAAKPGQLNILLIDEIGRLDTKSRASLYRKCIEKGVHFIATRAADTDEIEVTALDSVADVDRYEAEELARGEKTEAVS